ncbi:MAG: hypothetical protein IKG81_13405 [Bacteroidales bacterium]|nr:hypothetical protein [Bacteroidales bacterium]
MKKTILTQERHLCHIHFYLIAAALSLFFLSGCKDDNITPCGCEHILDWAPDTCSFSLSEYNSLKQVKDYLYQHDSTIVSHAGDTVKFWGWVYFHGPEEPIYEPYALNPVREDWNVDAKRILLVGNEDHHFHHNEYGAAWLWWDEAFLLENPQFVQDFDSLLQKKWYVTAIMDSVRTDRSFGPLCNKWGFKFSLINVDTIQRSN